MKKIIDNLFLGDRFSAPDNSDLIIACAAEIFEEVTSNKKSNGDVYWLDEHHVFFNFDDYPSQDSIDLESVIELQSVLDNAIDNGKKVYIHCLYGVNRSASMVFVYMVRHNLLAGHDYKTCQTNFWKIYPNHSPNQGWKNFLISKFPYNFNS